MEFWLMKSLCLTKKVNSNFTMAKKKKKNHD